MDFKKILGDVILEIDRMILKALFMEPLKAAILGNTGAPYTAGIGTSGGLVGWAAGLLGLGGTSLTSIGGGAYATQSAISMGMGGALPVLVVSTPSSLRAGLLLASLSASRLLERLLASKVCRRVQVLLRTKRDSPVLLYTLAGLLLGVRQTLNHLPSSVGRSLRVLLLGIGANVTL
jgi:hypothetical protein